MIINNDDEANYRNYDNESSINKIHNHTHISTNTHTYKDFTSMKQHKIFRTHILKFEENM